MSRIGKLPISIPAGIEVQMKGQTIHVKGPKGELTLPVHELIEIKIEDAIIKIQALSETKLGRSLHGLFRSLINNMITGVKNGFEKKLEIEGVGFKAQVQGKKLILNLGYSHPIEFHIPAAIEIKQDAEKKNVLMISGMDKQLVGQVAANIRGLKKPEPYKGKGIRYFGEVITRKAGKSAAKEKV